MKLINTQLIEKVAIEAKYSPRKRMNYNFHETLDANVQRMLNALEPGTYIQPHKHEDPDKFEAFLLLHGKALVIEFNDRGDIIEKHILSGDSGNIGVEIAPCHWHCILALEPQTVIYEIKDGPYSPINDKNFASWAPKEGDPGCQNYLNQLLKECGVTI